MQNFAGGTQAFLLRLDHHLLGATSAPPEISSSAGGGGEGAGGGDLQELARELLCRRGIN